MIPGYPFTELSQINNDFVRIDGSYSHVMVQRRVIQYSARYALAIFESIAGPRGSRQRNLFAIEIWQKCRWTQYWRRFSSMRIQRKYVPMLREILSHMLEEDPVLLAEGGLARMDAEIARRGGPDDFTDAPPDDLPFGFVNC